MTFKLKPQWQKYLLTGAMILSCGCSLNSLVAVAQVGGWTEATDTEEANNVALKAARELSQAEDSLNYLVPASILKLESQVVSGIMWRLDASFVRSTCQKNDVSPDEVTMEACPPNGGDHYHCILKIWEQSWTNKFEIVEKSCE
jgi:hypothetical protein